MICFIDCRPAIAGYIYCYNLPTVYFVLNENTISTGGTVSITLIKTSPYNINKLDQLKTTITDTTVIYRNTKH